MLIENISLHHSQSALIGCNFLTESWNRFTDTHEAHQPYTRLWAISFSVPLLIYRLLLILFWATNIQNDIISTESAVVQWRKAQFATHIICSSQTIQQKPQNNNVNSECTVRDNFLFIQFFFLSFSFYIQNLSHDKWTTAAHFQIHLLMLFCSGIHRSPIDAFISLHQIS